MPVVRNEILIPSCRLQNQLFKCLAAPGLLHVSSPAEMEDRDWVWCSFGFYLFGFFFKFNLP